MTHASTFLTTRSTHILYRHDLHVENAATNKIVTVDIGPVSDPGMYTLTFLDGSTLNFRLIEEIVSALLPSKNTWRNLWGLLP